MGGRIPEGFISWNAYPDETTTIPGHKYRYLYSDASAARIGYANWAGNLEFQFSQGSPSLGGEVTWKTRMTLNANGEIKLCGDFRAKRIVVENLTGWCDYVFKPGYTPMTLYEIEKFIFKYHHLPEVPCEEELMQNGIDVYNMQAVQMKKIEELYLYTISQQKEIDDLKQLVTKLEELIHVLSDGFEVNKK